MMTRSCRLTPRSLILAWAISGSKERKPKVVNDLNCPYPNRIDLICRLCLNKSIPLKKRQVEVRLMKNRLRWVTQILPSPKVKINIRFKINSLSSCISSSSLRRGKRQMWSNYRHRLFTSRSRTCSNKLKMIQTRISDTRRTMAIKSAMKLILTQTVANKKSPSSKAQTVWSRGAALTMMTMSRRLKSHRTRQATKTFSPRSSQATWSLRPVIWEGKRPSSA